MERIAQALGSHHKPCNELLAKSEAAAIEQCWAELQNLHTRFARALNAHLPAEEDVPVAAFGSDTGSSTGVTQVMRKEYKAMRENLEHLGQASSQPQSETYADLEETLLIRMPRRSLVKENSLYPMRDRPLSRRAHVPTYRLAKVLAAS